MAVAVVGGRMPFFLGRESGKQVIPYESSVWGKENARLEEKGWRKELVYSVFFNNGSEGVWYIVQCKGTFPGIYGG